MASRPTSWLGVRGQTCHTQWERLCTVRHYHQPGQEHSGSHAGNVVAPVVFPVVFPSLLFLTCGVSQTAVVLHNSSLAFEDVPSCFIADPDSMSNGGARSLKRPSVSAGALLIELLRSVPAQSSAPSLFSELSLLQQRRASAILQSCGPILPSRGPSWLGSGSVLSLVSWQSDQVTSGIHRPLGKGFSSREGPARNPNLWVCGGLCGGEA